MDTQNLAATERRSTTTPAGRSIPSRQELLWVCLVVCGISAILFWRFLPLPHQDLNFFTEPAYQLARFGRLAAPGSQSYDLTFQKGIYCYPPGYFLLLAAWLRLFGLSANSLLAYTHLVHAIALILLWLLLRKRYQCGRVVSVLVLLAMFPRMAHGRPDLTAVALSLAAWLALPQEFSWARLVLSGCLAGATLLVSPAFGVAIISTLAVLLLLRPEVFEIRLRNMLFWLATAAGVFQGVTAAVLAQQHTWQLAFVQFGINSKIRGAALNAWPSFRIAFTWEFCVVPFVLIALVPAMLVTAGAWRDSPKELRKVSIAFLASTLVWLTLNKSQLLLDHHFLYPAKSVFLGMFYSWPKFPAWLRIGPMVLLCAISFYYYKADFLYLGSPLRMEEQQYSASLHLTGMAAVDSLYFANFYRPGETLNYEVSAFEDNWRRYKAAIPTFAAKNMLSGLQDKPEEATTILISGLTAARLKKEPDPDSVCHAPPDFEKKLRAFGRTWNLPADPYALMVCTGKAP